MRTLLNKFDVLRRGIETCVAWATRPCSALWNHGLVARATPARRDRRGSILIMVVSVLVLLALMGTAYISVARLDRYAGTAGNQQDPGAFIETVVLGVEQLPKDAILNDLFATGVYRPVDLTGTGTYEHSDSHLTNPIPGGKDDSWLAQRLPVEFDLSGTLTPMWRAISRPLVQPTTGTQPAFFESPYSRSGVNPNAYAPTDWLRRPYPQYTPDVLTTAVVPSSLVISYPADYSDPALRDKTRVFPAFQFCDLTATPTPQLWMDNGSPPRAIKYLAADADGDGIADSGLVRLTEFGGVTYFYACRIIDNNSAINVNTAFARNNDYAFPATPQVNQAYFRSNVGLFEVLNPLPAAMAGNEFDLINAYRFNGQTTPNATPVEEPDATNLNNPTARADFAFTSLGEAMDAMLGRRLIYPGLRDVAPAPAGTRYLSYPLIDSTMLAYRFGFVLPNVTTPSAELEKAVELLPAIDSIYESSPNFVQDAATRSQFYYFPANNAGFWYTYNFLFDDPTRRTGDLTSAGASDMPLPLRNILTAFNPVSNAFPEHISATAPPGGNGVPNMGIYPDPVSGDDIFVGMLPYDPILDTWAATTNYLMGQIVRFAETAADPFRTYICIRAHTGQQPVTGGAVNRAYWDYQPYSETQVKASLNTATFRELWRAYWNVIADDQTGESPFGPDTPDYNNYDRTFQPQRMFRSSMRDTRFTPIPPTAEVLRFKPDQMAQLRAALAAVNTIDLRDTDEIVTVGTEQRKLGSVTSKKIILTISGGGDLDGDGNLDLDQPAEVTVYGYEPQPFITEVYVNTDPVGPNPNGYVAVELYNPYDFPLVLDNWNLGVMDRRPNPNAPSPNPPVVLTGPAPVPLRPRTVLKPLTGFINGFDLAYKTAYTGLASVLIPARSRIVLDNHDVSAAQARPAETFLPAAGPAPGVYFVPGLHEVIESTLTTGGELVLLRPRRQLAGLTPGGQLATSVVPDNAYDEITIANLYDMVPVDQFDFTGLVNDGAMIRRLHYKRESNESTLLPSWTCVYPGSYDGTIYGTAVSRHWGAAVVEDLLTVTPATYKSFQVGSKDALAHTITLGQDVPHETSYLTTFPIQLPFDQWPGPYPVSAAGNQFPFGGFARTGDVLKVPFIGAYRVRLLSDLTGGAADPTLLLEMNSITMDAAFADDVDINDDAALPNLVSEQVGRFCPVGNPVAGNLDYDPALASGVRYAWASDIFDYVTVQAPHDDYLPDVDPAPVDPTIPAAPAAFKYPGPAPQAVGNADILDPNINDDVVGVEGLINVNTASWKVLAALPLVVDDTSGVVDVTATEDLAKVIVHFRDVDDGSANPPVPHGPFTSLFDLCRVVDTLPPPTTDGFQNMWGNAQPDIDDNQGDLSPLGQGTADGIVDFEDHYAQLTRLSNLLTTRSDTFTCYLLVQGWREVGTETPQLVAEKRSGFIINRSTVTATDIELEPPQEIKTD